MTDGAGQIALLMRLQALLSPAFPTGGFSHSGGLEAAVEAGEAGDAASLRDWLECWLEDGPGRSDAIFVAVAAKAVSARDWRSFAEAAELAAVFTPSKERRVETRAQGAAFLKAARTAHPWPDAEGQGEAERRLGPEPAYPVVFGAWAGAFGAAPATAAALYLQAAVANLISAGQRLRLLGQSEGQALLAALAPLAEGLGRDAEGAGLDDVGGAMIRGDLASMRHETQRVRLFRT